MSVFTTTKGKFSLREVLLGVGVFVCLTLNTAFAAVIEGTSASEDIYGTEDDDIIAPVVADLSAAGHKVRGPMPADTAFTPAAGHKDAVLAMYHDQGLPVLKYAGFGHAVNVTLGLPIVRTSVDHGTALDIAGTGKADAGSLLAAVRLAAELAAR